MSRLTFKTVARKVLIGFSALLIAIVLVAAIYINSLLPIITGYAAKNLASAMFISERMQEEVESTDLNFSFIKLNKNSVDIEEKSVTSRFLWGKSTAIYRDGFGVTLLRDITPDEIKNINYPSDVVTGYSRDTIDWPMGDLFTMGDTGIDIESLDLVSDNLVNKDKYGGNAFAFMVLHKGVPVAEAYKSQFNSNTRFLSWSMAKSVTNALIGILVYNGIVDIEESALLPEWSDDDRSTITLNNLMQMQSGLKWNEDYGNRSDVTVMLHCENDFAQFAYNQPLEYPAGTHWYYSSGTTNIVSKIIRDIYSDDASYYSFPNNDLFFRIGITDALFEPDASGTLVGSSYLYMSARDYARFALLYIQDGVFNGERILPEGWVDYVTTPSSASNGGYGSFFWLNEGGAVPTGPKDMYMCIGHDGQRIFIMPSQELVVVVLGYSPNGSMDFNALIGDILSTVEE
jgi:hypothetical protein